MSAWLLDFVMAAVRAATPLVFCALAVLLAERAGIVFLGVEGTMLIGALAGILGTISTGSSLLGILLTIAVGAATGLLLGVLLIRLPTDQVVVGVAFNLAALGGTSYIFRLADTKALAIIPQVPALIFGLTGFELLAIVLTIACWWFLFRSGPGLKLRSVGESALTADAAGINVIQTRTWVMIAAGILSAMGGAALSVGWVRIFAENITLGRGFIALAAVYFGKWNPLFAALAALLFGAGEAIALRSQSLGISISVYYLMMVPYLLTIIAIGISGKARGPADVGNIYLRR